MWSSRRSAWVRNRWKIWMEHPDIFPCNCLRNCGRVYPRGEVDWWTCNVNIQCYHFLCTKHPIRSLGAVEKWLWYSPFICQQRGPVFLGLWVQIQFKNWKLLAFYNSTHLGQSEVSHGTVPNSSPQLLPTSVWEQHDYVEPRRRIWDPRILFLAVAQTWLLMLLQAQYTG